MANISKSQTDILDDKACVDMEDMVNGVNIRQALKLLGRVMEEYRKTHGDEDDSSSDD